jgi:DNA polymerase-3 subunit alpha
MAFANLEDIQGSIELVIFPKVWEKQSSLVHMDAVLFAEGKVDSASGDAKILVDLFRPIRPEDVTDEMRLQATEIPDVPSTPTEYQSGQTENNLPEDAFLFEEPVFAPGGLDWHLEPPAAVADPVVVVKENSTHNVDLPAPELIVVSLAEEGDVSPTDSQPEFEEKGSTALVSQRPPVIVSPVDPATLREGANFRQLITIILKDSGQKERDVRRMKRIHGLLNSYPGDDRYCFLVFESGHQHLLDFPNSTTAATGELLNKLVELVGQENVQIERV